MRIRIGEAEEIFGKYFSLRQDGYDHRSAAKEVGARGRRIFYLGEVYSSGLGSVIAYERAQREKRKDMPQSAVFGALVKGGLERQKKSARWLARNLRVSQRQVSAYTSLHKFPSGRTRKNIYPLLDIDETRAEELLEAAISGRLEAADISDSVNSVLGGKSASDYFKPEPVGEKAKPEKMERAEQPEKEKITEQPRKESGVDVVPMYQSTAKAADKTAAAVITLDEMKLAIEASVGMDNEGAEILAQHVLNFFGFSDKIIDNVLEPGDRDIFYQLEDWGILETEREETTLYDGREWRIHYWLLKREKILELAEGEKNTEAKKDKTEEVYGEVPQDVWRNHARLQEEHQEEVPA